jgi:hypothetical protein
VTIVDLILETSESSLETDWTLSDLRNSHSKVRNSFGRVTGITGYRKAFKLLLKDIPIFRFNSDFHVREHKGNTRSNTYLFTLDGFAMGSSTR